MKTLAEQALQRNTIVIGAGLSGLVAAKELNACGVDVAVFEKARGTGGRLGSKRVSIDLAGNLTPAESITFDLGASSFSSVSKKFKPFLATLYTLGLAVRNSDKRFLGIPRNSMVTRHLSEGIEVEFSKKISRIEKINGQWCLYAESKQDQRQPQGKNDASENNNQDAEVELMAICEHLILAIPAEQAAELLPAHHDAFTEVNEIHGDPAFVSTFVIDGLSKAVIEQIDSNPDSMINEVSLEHLKPGRNAHGYNVIKLTTTSEWASAHIEDGNEKVAEALLERLQRLLPDTSIKVVKQYTHRWLYSQYSQLHKAPYLSYEDNLHLTGDYFDVSNNENAADNEFIEGIERAFLSAHNLSSYLLNHRYSSDGMKVDYKLLKNLAGA